MSFPKMMERNTGHSSPMCSALPVVVFIHLHKSKPHIFVGVPAAEQEPSPESLLNYTNGDVVKLQETA